MTKFSTLRVAPVNYSNWEMINFIVLLNLKYLFNIIPTSVRPCNTRNTNNIPQFKVKHIFLQTYFFPSIVIIIEARVKITSHHQPPKMLSINFKNSEFCFYDWHICDWYYCTYFSFSIIFATAILWKRKYSCIDNHL